MGWIIFVYGFRYRGFINFLLSILSNNDLPTVSNTTTGSLPMSAYSTKLPREFFFNIDVM